MTALHLASRVVDFNIHPSTTQSSSASTKLHPSVRISASTSPTTRLSTSSISPVQNTRIRPSSLIRASLSLTICTAAVSSSSPRPSALASAAPNPSRTSLSTSSPTAASTWPRISSANRPRSNSKLSCTPCATSTRTSSRSRSLAASGLVHIPSRIRTSPSPSTLRLDVPDDGGDGEHDDDDDDDDDGGGDDTGLLSISTTRRRVTARVLSGDSSRLTTGVPERQLGVGVNGREGMRSQTLSARESSARISVEARGRRTVRPRAKGRRALRGIPWLMSRKKGSISTTPAGIPGSRAPTRSSATGTGGRFVKGFLAIGITVSVLTCQAGASTPCFDCDQVIMSLLRSTPTQSLT
ncbi:hypothetical protein LZ32DRAFT_641028 [Colletotrichum eremochloae]|nr:hypothetical protein LZ32DRAFT_641028 [Colletotrichum eremochloae]